MRLAKSDLAVSQSVASVCTRARSDEASSRDRKVAGALSRKVRRLVDALVRSKASQSSARRSGSGNGRTATSRRLKIRDAGLLCPALPSTPEREGEAGRSPYRRRIPENGEHLAYFAAQALNRDQFSRVRHEIGHYRAKRGKSF